jgi:KDO2-lipid IV(A) lauroyltransferase
LKSLPGRIALAASYAFTDVLAWILRVCGFERRLLERHLDRCLPALEPRRRGEVIRGFYRYLGELTAEVLYEPLLDKATLAERMRFENPDVVSSLLAQQRRVLILSSHHANWEWLLLRCSTGFEQPLTAVYKRISTAWADRWALRLRQKFGCRMVRDKEIVTHLLEQRGRVRLLAMLADQSPAAANEQQLWLEFFGQPTAFHAGPGWIATKFAFTPVFAAVSRERRGHYRVRFTELRKWTAGSEPEQVLRSYIAKLEEQVRADPEHYFWAYNRWKREKPLYG